MATIVTRTNKGSNLSNAEVDANFINLNTELATKVSLASPVFTTAATIPTSSSFQITANNISAVKPTLQLDFLNNTKLDSRIAFSRTHTVATNVATRVNSKGFIETVGSGVPRFDYSPVTRAPLGLLLESARTNNILSSGNAAVTHQVTVTGGSGTFQNAETVAAGGGGVGQYDAQNSSATIFGVMNGTGTFTGTLTGLSSGATRTITTNSNSRNLNNVTATPFSYTSPDGTQTAVKLVETTTSGVHGSDLLTSGIFNFTLNAYYACSVYAKAAERSQLIIGAGVTAAFTSAQYGKFDLATGTASVFSGTPTVSIIDAGNGWYRCTVVIRASATGASSINLKILNPSSLDTYEGESNSGLFIWGLQLESGENSTSYIPTTTTTWSRIADIATMNSVIPWYNQTEGTIFAQFRAGSVNFPSATQSVLQLGSTASSINNIYMARGGGATTARARFVSRTPLGTDVDTTVGSGIAIPAYSVARVAGAIATNNYILAHRGVLGTADTGAIVPNVESMTLGWYIFSTQRLDGHLQSVMYYPKRLSNSELQALTT